MAEHFLEAKGLPEEHQHTLPNDMEASDHVAVALRCVFFLNCAFGSMQGPHTSKILKDVTYTNTVHVQVMRTVPRCLRPYARLVSPLGYVLFRSAGTKHGFSGPTEETSTKSTPWPGSLTTRDGRGSVQSALEHVFRIQWSSYPSRSGPPSSLARCCLWWALLPRHIEVTGLANGQQRKRTRLSTYRSSCVHLHLVQFLPVLHMYTVAAPSIVLQQIVYQT